MTVTIDASAIDSRSSSAVRPVTMSYSGSRWLISSTYSSTGLAWARCPRTTIRLFLIMGLFRVEFCPNRYIGMWLLFRLERRKKRLLGDDRFVTNADRVKWTICTGSVTAVLTDLNEAGTVDGCTEEFL
jgi:hypothetical protein